MTKTGKTKLFAAFVCAGASVFLAFLIFAFLKNLCGMDPVWNTVYSPEFTESAFLQIRHGDSEERVVALLGQPVRKEPYNGPMEAWCYAPKPADAQQPIPVICTDIAFGPEDTVIAASGNYLKEPLHLMPKEDIQKRYGAPSGRIYFDGQEKRSLPPAIHLKTELLASGQHSAEPRREERHYRSAVILSYAWPRHGTRYQAREIYLDTQGKVILKLSYRLKYAGDLTPSSRPGAKP